MKILFWRRKPKQDADATTLPAGGASDAPPIGETTARGSVATVERVDRSDIPTRPLAMPPEVRDAVLRFAVETLSASGARVRAEAEDLITATLPDGTSERYTTTLALAREDEETRLLVQGGAALADLVDRCAIAAAFGALALGQRVDPVGAARTGVCEPPDGCERCTTSFGRGGLDACDQCPLRDERIVLRGLDRLGGGSVAREGEAESVELAYEIAYSDRQGRKTEWVRLAFDLSSLEPRAPLDHAALRGARTAAVPAASAARLDELAQRAERTLLPRIAAGAAFLRLRSERDFRDRLADLESTANRLLRDTPGDEEQIRASLKTEIERLTEVFAVDAEARLQSVCFIRSTVAEVLFQRSERAGVTLTVDLGRGSVLSPQCAACGTALRSGRVCGHGHMTCVECAERGQVPEFCAACEARRDSGSAPKRTKRTRRSREAAQSGTGELTIAGLREMSEETWREFVRWLAEQDGIRVERAAEAGGISLWSGRLAEADTPVVVAAHRPDAPLLVSGEDVRRAAAAASGGDPGVPLRLFTAAPASDDASSEARRLGVDLLDGGELARRLEALEVARLFGRESERAAAGALAAAATQARQAVLAELAALEDVLARAVNGRRASGRAAVAAAATAAGAARQEALRAFLAWDTLAGEWMASFDERAGREGALVVLADEERFADMTTRAAHLRDATRTALERIGDTPGAGDLGYGAWRRAVVEELTARCESCRWRLLAIDPDRWDDFAAAQDTAALERATGAAAAAGHAAARAAKAYADMAARARL